MIIRALPVGPLQAYCYVVGCEQTSQAAVIDPGGDVDRILSSIESDKLKVAAIINTHGHFDHTGGNYALKSATDASLMIHKLDAPMLEMMEQMGSAWGIPVENSPSPDRLLEDAETIDVGDLQMSVIHTPGHSPGGVCLHVASENALFVGDTLFAGSIGRADLPGGDYDTLISSIQTKLFALPEETTVYSGHTETTTIGREKKYNPFCGVR